MRIRKRFVSSLLLVAPSVFVACTSSRQVVHARMAVTPGPSQEPSVVDAPSQGDEISTLRALCAKAVDAGTTLDAFERIESVEPRGRPVLWARGHRTSAGRPVTYHFRLLELAGTPEPICYGIPIDAPLFESAATLADVGTGGSSKVWVRIYRGPTEAYGFEKSLLEIAPFKEAQATTRLELGRVLGSQCHGFPIHLEGFLETGDVLITPYLADGMPDGGVTALAMIGLRNGRVNVLYQTIVGEHLIRRDDDLVRGEAAPGYVRVAGRGSKPILDVLAWEPDESPATLISSRLRWDGERFETMTSVPSTVSSKTTTARDCSE